MEKLNETKNRLVVVHITFKNLITGRRREEIGMTSELPMTHYCHDRSMSTSNSADPSAESLW